MPHTLSAMLPAALWLIYALPAYVLWTLIFPLRYGFWPVAGRLPSRTLYGWVDLLLAGSIVIYTTWIVLGALSDSSRAISVPGGVALWAMGVALRWWTVVVLGPYRRIGQDERELVSSSLLRGRSVSCSTRSIRPSSSSPSAKP
jgi:hypothetical protein